jgi:formylglycine-generating enzyme required for sulfatase activity
VLRGGSWFNSGDVARSAFREVATPGYNYLPGFNFFVAGFRCIRSLP